MLASIAKAALNRRADEMPDMDTNRLTSDKTHATSKPMRWQIQDLIIPQAKMKAVPQ
ncbi:hypothetical protein RsS62_45840 [Rhizobium dioscoreae]|nr:hypothetical protein RsS62_45840 [Rhizobium dioscoreae]